MSKKVYFVFFLALQLFQLINLNPSYEYFLFQKRKGNHSYFFHLQRYRLTLAAILIAHSFTFSWWVYLTTADVDLYCCLWKDNSVEVKAFHCHFHLEEFSIFFAAAAGFWLDCSCFCSSNFLGGIATVEIGLVTTFFDVPYFRLLSQHRRAVIIDELIKLTTIIVMKVKNKIPEVLDNVTHMECSSGAFKRWSISSITLSLKFCDEGNLKATSSGLKTWKVELVFTSPKLAFFIAFSCLLTRWFW